MCLVSKSDRNFQITQRGEVWSIYKLHRCIKNNSCRDRPLNSASSFEVIQNNQIFCELQSNVGHAAAT